MGRLCCGRSPPRNLPLVFQITGSEEGTAVNSVLAARPLGPRAAAVRSVAQWTASAGVLAQSDLVRTQASADKQGIVEAMSAIGAE